MHTMEKGEVGVRSIYQKHTIPLYRIPPGHGQVVRFSVGDHEDRGNGVPMIIVYMEFDGAFGLPEPRPIEHTQTQFDDSRVPGTNFVRDAGGSTAFHPLELIQQRREQLHIDLP